MSSIPLEKLPTIKGKLGSVIVIAVGVTVVLIFLMLGYGLRGTSPGHRPPHAGADRAPGGGGHARERAGRDRDRADDDRRHDPGGGAAGAAPGVRRRYGRTSGPPRSEYAVVPVVVDGQVIELVYAVQPAPGRGFFARVGATFTFLADFWWQFLLAGAIAAAIALMIARWLARGMTQPLRDMAAAARRMEKGDYSARVHARSRDEVGQLAAAFNRMSAELDRLERSRRDLVANVSHELKTADHGDPRAPGEPARRRRAAQPRDAAGHARAVGAPRPARGAAARPVAARVGRGAARPRGRTAGAARVAGAVRDQVARPDRA